MNWWTIALVVGGAVLLFDTTLRMHLWMKVHNTLAAISNALHTIWSHITNSAPPPPPPPPISTPPAPPAA